MVLFPENISVNKIKYFVYIAKDLVNLNQLPSEITVEFYINHMNNKHYNLTSQDYPHFKYYNEF